MRWMPMILMSAIAPPVATAAGRVGAAAAGLRLFAADAEGAHAPAATSAATSIASQRKITRFGCKPPPRRWLAPTRSNQVARHFTTSTNEIVPGGKHHKRQHQRQSE